jgi:hypothetical protein
MRHAKKFRNSYKLFGKFFQCDYYGKGWELFASIFTAFRGHMNTKHCQSGILFPPRHGVNEKNAPAQCQKPANGAGLAISTPWQAPHPPHLNTSSSFGLAPY